MAEPNMFRSSVDREVMWAAWMGPGLEHLRLLTSDGGTVVASGLVIGLEAGRPFRIGYEVRCDGCWWAACPSPPGPGFPRSAALPSEGRRVLSRRWLSRSASS